LSLKPSKKRLEYEPSSKVAKSPLEAKLEEAKLEALKRAYTEKLPPGSLVEVPTGYGSTIPPSVITTGTWPTPSTSTFGGEDLTGRILYLGNFLNGKVTVMLLGNSVWTGSAVYLTAVGIQGVFVYRSEDNSSWDDTYIAERVSSALNNFLKERPDFNPDEASTASAAP
jgi:hypothetical protein